MQVTQPECTNNNRQGVDKQFINFKSSPNFKGMKKFIISKIDHDKTTNTMLPTHAAEPPPPPNLEAIVKPEVQTPTEMDPPQPDEVLDLNVLTKIENDEYHKDVEEDTGFIEQEMMMSSNDEGSTKLPKSSTICRDFIRGVCKRPNTCRFSHTYETSQLTSIYTFCRDFQNKTCTFPNCKYVHASVFEEQNFYRTGKLPPHIEIREKPDIMQPPPPPPPAPPVPTVSTVPPVIPPVIQPVPQTYMPEMYTNMPPPMYQSWPHTITSAPMESCSSATGVMPMLQDQCVPEHPYVMYNTEEKKCQYCDLMKLKLQWQKDKLKKKMKSVETLKQKIADTKEKNKKLDLILMMVLKIKGLLADTNLARLMVMYLNNSSDMPDLPFMN